MPRTSMGVLVIVVEEAVVGMDEEIGDVVDDVADGGGREAEEVEAEDICLFIGEILCIVSGRLLPSTSSSPSSDDVIISRNIPRNSSSCVSSLAAMRNRSEPVDTRNMCVRSSRASAAGEPS